MQEQTRNPVLTKLQKKAQKLTKMLIEKYRFADHDTTINKQRLNQFDKNIDKTLIDLEGLRQTDEKSERINSKLKLIRTLLGYECHKKNTQETKIREQNSKQQEGRNSLKNYVLTMRRKSQFTGSFQSKRHNKTMSLNIQNALTQYTDSSIKFIHSFLPHQSMLEQRLANKLRLNQRQNVSKNHSYENKSFKTLIPLNQSNSKRTSMPNQRQIQSPLALQSAITLQPSLVLQKSNQLKSQASERAIFLNLYTIQTTEPKNTIKFNGPSQIYQNRVSQLFYRGKNYKKDFYKSVKMNRQMSKNRQGSENGNQKLVMNGSQSFHLPQIKISAPDLISKPRRSVHN